MTILSSQKATNASPAQRWRVDCPVLPGRYTGTGDLCAALLLAHTAMEPDNLALAMQRVVNTMYAVIERTHKQARESIASQELRLIQSKQVIEQPPERFQPTRIE